LHECRQIGDGAEIGEEVVHRLVDRDGMTDENVTLRLDPYVGRIVQPIWVSQRLGLRSSYQFFSDKS
jgi:hypothetical protein